VELLACRATRYGEIVRKVCESALTEARQIPGKHDRGDKVYGIRDAMLDELFPEKTDGNYGEWAESADRRRQAKEAFRTLEKKITRKLIVEKGLVPTAASSTEIRPLEMEVGIFERTHGSAFFQRGETQSLVSCTLGTGRTSRSSTASLPEYSKKFYLHYNFPPFCVGEAGASWAPAAARSATAPSPSGHSSASCPRPDDFPYTIRIVSDITESNGSSSMASVCGGCLALMDAGVPIKNTCAGISVGRFSDENGDTEVFVTDIIGEEDFFGDMDFKVSGTHEGITGIQLDLKARGLQIAEIEEIFEQARVGRLDIIKQMEAVIDGPRGEISDYAPRIETLSINPDKIGKLIGPGGKTIRAIQEKWGVNIDVEDDGSVMIAASDGPALKGALAEVEALVAEIKVGTIFEGKVVSLKDFGAFIELAPGTDGMCHISELSEGYVKEINDVVSIGDVLRVKVINVDDQGRIKLSRKAVILEEQAESNEPEEVAAGD
jgi:polyribonucleotide nucleotidyltransferase